MTYKMTHTCAELLARAYYALDLIGAAAYYQKAARKNSLRHSLRLQWIDADHRITDQGLWELRRAVNNPPNRVRDR